VARKEIVASRHEVKHTVAKRFQIEPKPTAARELRVVVGVPGVVNVVLSCKAVPFRVPLVSERKPPLRQRRARVAITQVVCDVVATHPSINPLHNTAILEPANAVDVLERMKY